MKKKIFAKIISICLMLTLCVGLLAPFTVVEAEAKNVNYVNVPSSMVGVSKMHAISTTVTAIGTAIKGIGAIKYASENAQTLDEFIDMTLAYFSGNAQENERLNDLEATMLEQFQMTYKGIEDLKKDISALSTQIESTKKDILNKVEYESLKGTLEAFYDDYFNLKYQYLISAYDHVEAIYDGEEDISLFKERMDTLYASCRELDALEGYLTSKGKISDTAIFDDYFRYLFLKNNITSADHPKYAEVVEECQLFALKLYAADVMQKYCLAFVSAYHLNYVKSTGDSYVVEDVSLPDSQYTLSEYSIKKNLERATSGIPLVAASVARAFAGLYNSSAFVGYNEGGYNYYAPTITNEDETILNVYYGAEYQLVPLADSIEDMLLNDFSYVIRGSSSTTISSTGKFTVNDSVGSSFTVAYVYGEGSTVSNDALDNYPGVDVYTIKVNVIDRPLGGGYGNLEAPYLIGTADHLATFASKSDYHKTGVYTRLSSDINVSGKTLSRISEYYGVFDGDNHTIKNYSGSSALISTNNGTIKNVTYESLSVNSSGAGTRYLGGIANINNSLIVNCHVKLSSLHNYSHNYPGGSQGYTDFTSVVGAIAGINAGTVTRCSVTGSTIKGSASTDELYNAGLVYTSDDMTQYTKIYIGGIAGESTGDVTDCYAGNTTLSTQTNATYYKWKFLWNHTYNRVSATIYHGAAIGYSTGSQSNNSYNNITDSVHNVSDKAKDATDKSFVSSSTPTGVNGNLTGSQSISNYFTSIDVDLTPYNSSYMIGESINTSGLEVKDNHGNYIYGYSVSDVSITEFKKYTVTVTYQGLTDTFQIEAKCVHKNTTIGNTTPATCLADGVAAGLWCNDCEKYIGGNTKITKSNAYCVDGTNDHKCDNCLRALPLCYDNNRDHICDVCVDVMSVCEDKNNDYACDYCTKNICNHNDTDDDHLCNLCGLKFTECVDQNNDHKCNTCGKTLTYCQDYDDHYCDKCNDKITECADKNRDHRCDVCRVKLSECGDTNSDHSCDLCGAQLSGHTDPNNDHICNYCNGKASDCKDDSRDHLCDICGAVYSICMDTDRNHACDVCAVTMGAHAAALGSHFCAYCSQRVSNCSDANKDHDCDICISKLTPCSDADRNHFCEWCGVEMSVHSDQDNHLCDVCGISLTTCLDSNFDHLCDICQKRLTNCVDENRDHDCDICSGKYSDHTDLNRDHVCEWCNAKISDCKDEIPDHNCDICSAVLSYCGDTDKNHICDICSVALSVCTDGDKNHFCEICEKKLSEHIDANKDHVCEYCSATVSDHFDDGDHKCDICQIIISGCADKNGDHRCDVCAKILSECGDSNRNHFCDVCESRLSKHGDDNDDGECDLCFVDVENHEDEDNDGNCDICGDPWEPWQMPWWLVLVIIFGGLALFFGIGYIICMWDDFC